MSEIVAYPLQMKGESIEAYRFFKMFARTSRMSLKQFCELHEDIVYSTASKWHFKFDWRARRAEYQDAMLRADDCSVAKGNELIRTKMVSKMLEILDSIEIKGKIEDPLKAIECTYRVAKILKIINDMEPEEEKKLSTMDIWNLRKRT